MDNLRIIKKDKVDIPEDAKILDKRKNAEVEEIENGYLIVRHCSVEYSHNGSNHHKNYTKKVFTKENPVKIKQDTMLADLFD